MSSNRALLTVSREALHRLLKLPPDAVIGGIAFDPHYDCVLMTVDHPALKRRMEGDPVYRVSLESLATDVVDLSHATEVQS